MAEIKIYGTLVNDTNEAIVKSTQVSAVKQDGTAATQSAVNADLYAKYAAGAQVNVIEKITVNGMDFPVHMSGKTANIQLDEAGMPKDIRYNNGKFYLSNDYQGNMYTTTIQAATQSVPGFMSTTDKSKLDGIADGAQVNVIEKITIDGGSSFVSISGKTADISLMKGSLPTDIILYNGEFYLANKTQGPMFKTTIQTATQSAPGFMSAADKQRLDDAASAENLEATNQVINALGASINALTARVAALEAALTLK